MAIADCALTTGSILEQPPWRCRHESELLHSFHAVYLHAVLAAIALSHLRQTNQMIDPSGVNGQDHIEDSHRLSHKPTSPDMPGTRELWVLMV